MLSGHNFVMIWRKIIILWSDCESWGQVPLRSASPEEFLCIKVIMIIAVQFCFNF